MAVFQKPDAAGQAAWPARRTTAGGGCCGCSDATGTPAPPTVCAVRLPAWPVPCSASAALCSASAAPYSDRPKPETDPSRQTTDPPVHCSDGSEKLSDLLVAVSARGKMLCRVAVPNRYFFAKIPTSKKIPRPLSMTASQWASSCCSSMSRSFDMYK